MGVSFGSILGLQGRAKGVEGCGEGVRPSGSILLLFEDAELLELARSDSGVRRESFKPSVEVELVVVVVVVVVVEVFVVVGKLPTGGSFFKRFVILSGLYFSSLSLTLVAVGISCSVFSTAAFWCFGCL